MFRFEEPLALFLLVFVPLLILLPIWLQQHYRPAGLRFSDIGLAAQNTLSWRIRYRPLMNALRMLALALLIVGLARPQLGQGREIVQGEGVDIVMALDISGSMASLDFEPQNRLEAAKKVIGDFIDDRTFDRIGLVVFASEAFSQSPMTVDHEVLSRLLGQIDLATELGLQDGTAIGMGLANAANMLRESGAESKVIILLTDGVNNAGQLDPVTAAEAAEALDIKVYTIGMGRPGQVPLPVTDVFGREQVVYQESTLDETVLQALADTTGGLYFRAEDTDGLEAIYDQINELETSEVEVTFYAQYQELAGWVLLPGLMLMLAEAVLSRTVFRRIP